MRPQRAAPDRHAHGNGCVRGVDGDPAECAVGLRNASRCPWEVASLNSSAPGPPKTRSRIATGRWKGEFWVSGFRAVIRVFAYFTDAG